MIYYLLYVVFLVLALFGFVKLGPKTKRYLFLYIPMLLMIIIAGLRAQTVGADTLSYGKMFLNSQFEDIFLSNSFVYSTYIFILKKIFPSVVCFNFFNAILIYYSFMKFVEKYSSNYILSYCVFVGTGCLFNAMNQCREFMAIALCLWGFDAMIEEQWKKFILFSLLAVFVHNVSSILVGIMIALLIIRKVKINYMVGIAMLAVVLLYIYLNYDVLIYQFTHMFSHYQIYLQGWTGLFEEHKLSSSRFGYIFILSIFEMWIIFLFRKSGKKFQNSKDKYSRVEISLLIMNGANICFLILTTRVYLFLRVAMLFDVFWAVLLPNFINKYFKEKHFLNVALYIALIVYMTLLLRSDGSGVLPYKVFYK